MKLRIVIGSDELAFEIDEPVSFRELLEFIADWFTARTEGQQAKLDTMVVRLRRDHDRLSNQVELYSGR